MIISVKLSEKQLTVSNVCGNWTGKKMYLVYFTINLTCHIALETFLKITKVWSWLEKIKTSWIVGRLLFYALGSTQKGNLQMIKVWWVPCLIIDGVWEGLKQTRDEIWGGNVGNFKVVDAVLCWHNIGRCGKYHNILCTTVSVVRHVNLALLYLFFFSKIITTIIPSNGT